MNVTNGMPQSAVGAVKHGKPPWFPSETLKPSATRRSVATVEVRSDVSIAKPAEWRGTFCRFPRVNAKSTRRRGGITRTREFSLVPTEMPTEMPTEVPTETGQMSAFTVP